MTKTIFITGTSSGLGKLTALHFAKRGWNVAATMRTPEKERELTAYDNIKIFKLDVSHFSSSQQNEYVARHLCSSRVRGRTGFANRSFALRRCLVEILKRRDRLTAAELAGIAYGRRLIVRPGHHRRTVAQLVATRRASPPGRQRQGQNDRPLSATKSLRVGRERSPVTDAEIVLLEVREQIRARQCRRRLKCTRTSAPAAGRPSPRASPALARPPPARSDPYHPLAVGGGGGLVRSPGRPDRGDRGARPPGCGRRQARFPTPR